MGQHNKAMLDRFKSIWQAIEGLRTNVDNLADYIRGYLDAKGWDEAAVEEWIEKDLPKLEAEWLAEWTND